MNWIPRSMFIVVIMVHLIGCSKYPSMQATCKVSLTVESIRLDAVGKTTRSFAKDNRLNVTIIGTGTSDVLGSALRLDSNITFSMIPHSDQGVALFFFPTDPNRNEDNIKIAENYVRVVENIPGVVVAPIVRKVDGAIDRDGSSCLLKSPRT